MVSKERLEQRVVEFMEVSQHSIPDESLQARVQVSYTKRTKTPTGKCGKPVVTRATGTLFHRNLWMRIKIFRSRMRKCRPRSPPRYPLTSVISVLYGITHGLLSFLSFRPATCPTLRRFRSCECLVFPRLQLYNKLKEMVLRHVFSAVPSCIHVKIGWQGIAKEEFGGFSEFWEELWSQQGN